MAKGRNNPFGNVPGMGNIMKQVQKMAEDTERLDQELAEQRIEAASGGGMVKVVVSGKGELIDIKIDPQVVDPEDVEMLQDLIVSAMREALENAAKIKEEKLGSLTGGMNIPGLF
ncbi:MAG: YbaB/EbfC family nucleoid-associated protein [Armatimonadota bacterium]